MWKTTAVAKEILAFIKVLTIKKIQVGGKSSHRVKIEFKVKLLVGAESMRHLR